MQENSLIQVRQRDFDELIEWWGECGKLDPARSC